jgi:hypothetical protein
MKAKSKDSCKELFSKLGILTLYSQYIFPTLVFVVKNKDLFALNMEFHSINTCHKLDLCMPLVKSVEEYFDRDNKFEPRVSQ